MGERIHIRIKEIKTKSYEYISVYYNALRYSGSIPCTDKSQIQEAIEDCKRWIRREGDIPVVPKEGDY